MTEDEHDDQECVDCGHPRWQHGLDGICDRLDHTGEDCTCGEGIYDDEETT